MVRINTLAVMAAAVALTAAAQAQDFPNRPVRLIAGSPGGTSDFSARYIAQKLGERWRQQVVVDNRPAVGGIVAAEIVANATPDGHTLIVSGISVHATAQYLIKKLPFDPIRDFAPISNLTTSGIVIVVIPNVPVHNVREFIAYAKAKPGGVNYASSVAGSSSHLAGELFNQLTGAGLTHIPYKGAGFSLTALMTGEVQSAFLATTTTSTQVKAGRLRAIALLSEQRDQVMPEVPTAAEQGYRGLESNVWFGLFAPARTPADIVVKINRDVVAILREASTRQAMLSQGAEPAPLTPSGFAAFVSSENAKWGRVIRAAKIETQ
jgi:tripartite-type tricarboxylate transporter receptor subunit TctC